MTSSAPNENPIYRDSTRSIPERVRDLLGRMTLDEKIAQLGSAWVYELLDNGGFSPDKARALMQHGIGQITRIGGASSVGPADSARLAPGETKTMMFELDVRQLGFYNQDMAYVVEPGVVEVLVGSSSQDIRLRGGFTIVGAAMDISAAKVFFSAAHVK